MAANDEIDPRTDLPVELPWLNPPLNGAAGVRAPAVNQGIEPFSISMQATLVSPNGHSPLRRAYQRTNAWLGDFVGRFTLPEDDEPVDFFGFLAAATPPWLVSLIIHFSFMILLGLIAIGVHEVQKNSSIEVDLSKAPGEHDIYADRLGEQLDDPSVNFSTPGAEKLERYAAVLPTSDLPEVEDPLVGPPVITPSAEGTLRAGTIETPAIALELSGRQEGVKKAWLQAYGGTALTEDAVREGLKWLVKQQRPHGKWNLQGPYHNGANIENEEVSTALALLAFQGAGYTPDSKKDDSFTRAANKGWRALLESQQADGHFFGNVPREHQLYTQAICTIAICELYGMTREKKYRDAAQLAVDYCVKNQTPQGGWRYEPGYDSDMSVTGWFAMALQSARMAGIEVPSSAYTNIGKFLDSVQRDEGSTYGYQPNAGATLPLTAEGLLCRQYLGWAHDDPRLLHGVEYLQDNLPEWEKRNVYYWYYATQVCHHMEGDPWQKWNAVMGQLLPQHQEKHGPSSAGAGTQL